MSDLFIDRMEALNIVSERGVIRSCQRKCRIQLSREPVNDHLNDDHNALILARRFLIEQGFVEMQPMGNILNEDEELAPLVLIRTEFAIVENDKYTVDATLHYNHIIDGANQYIGINGPPSGLLWGKGRTSIVEKSTNFFYPEGDRTKPRVLLEVGHQFEITDTRAVAINHDPFHPRFVRQGGEISVPFPQGNYKCEAIVSVPFPHRLARALIASINLVEWMGEDPFTWLISEVTFEVCDPARPVGGFLKPTYKMGFEFQFNSDTWNPTITFKDQETGNPPAKVVKATEPDEFGVVRLQLLPFNPGGGQIGFDKVPAGYWQVPALKRIDFKQTFSALFEASES